jgi:hypothetical protein
MTVTHLFFALVTTAYILVAIQLVERDLMARHPEYIEYRKHVPMIVPGLPQRIVILPATQTASAWRAQHDSVPDFDKV